MGFKSWYQISTSNTNKILKSSDHEKNRIAIIGTVGIPAKYGGFETLAEQLVSNLSNEFDFTVYCSKRDTRKKKEFLSIKAQN